MDERQQRIAAANAHHRAAIEHQRLRDLDIRGAAEAGATTREIAEGIGLSFQRVAQIVKEGRGAS